jgi:hypothetical protein
MLLAINVFNYRNVDLNSLCSTSSHVSLNCEDYLVVRPVEVVNAFLLVGGNAD